MKPEMGLGETNQPIPPSPSFSERAGARLRASYDFLVERGSGLLAIAILVPSLRMEPSPPQKTLTDPKPIAPTSSPDGSSDEGGIMKWRLFLTSLLNNAGFEKPSSPPTQTGEPPKTKTPTPSKTRTGIATGTATGTSTGTATDENPTATNSPTAPVTETTVPIEWAHLNKAAVGSICDGSNCPYKEHGVAGQWAYLGSMDKDGDGIYESDVLEIDGQPVLFSISNTDVSPDKRHPFQTDLWLTTTVATEKNPYTLSAGGIQVEEEVLGSALFHDGQPARMAVAFGLTAAVEQRGGVPGDVTGGAIIVNYNPNKASYASEPIGGVLETNGNLNLVAYDRGQASTAFLDKTNGIAADIEVELDNNGRDIVAYRVAEGVRTELGRLTRFDSLKYPVLFLKVIGQNGEIKLTQLQNKIRPDGRPERDPRLNLSGLADAAKGKMTIGLTIDNLPEGLTKIPDGLLVIKRDASFVDGSEYYGYVPGKPRYGERARRLMEKFLDENNIGYKPAISMAGAGDNEYITSILEPHNGETTKGVVVWNAINFDGSVSDSGALVQLIGRIAANGNKPFLRASEDIYLNTSSVAALEKIAQETPGLKGIQIVLDQGVTPLRDVQQKVRGLLGRLKSAYGDVEIVGAVAGEYGSKTSEAIKYYQEIVAIGIEMGIPVAFKTDAINPGDNPRERFILTRQPDGEIIPNGEFYTAVLDKLKEMPGRLEQVITNGITVLKEAPKRAGEFVIDQWRRLTDFDYNLKQRRKSEIEARRKTVVYATDKTSSEPLVVYLSNGQRKLSAKVRALQSLHSQRHKKQHNVS